MWPAAPKKEASDLSSTTVAALATAVPAASSHRDKIEKIDETKPAPPDVLHSDGMELPGCATW